MDNQSSNLEKHANTFLSVRPKYKLLQTHISAHAYKSLFFEGLILSLLRRMKYTSMRRLFDDSMKSVFPGIPMSQKLNKLHLAFMMLRQREKSQQKYFTILPLPTKLHFIPVSQGFFTQTIFKHVMFFLIQQVYDKIEVYNETHSHFITLLVRVCKVSTVSSYL